MATIKCPNCGYATFTVRGWSAFDRCPRCRESLAQRDPKAVEAEVAERLYGPGSKPRGFESAPRTIEDGEGASD